MSDSANTEPNDANSIFNSGDGAAAAGDIDAADEEHYGMIDLGERFDAWQRAQRDASSGATGPGDGHDKAAVLTQGDTVVTEDGPRDA